MLPKDVHSDVKMADTHSSTVRGRCHVFDHFLPATGDTDIDRLLSYVIRCERTCRADPTPLFPRRWGKGTDESSVMDFAFHDHSFFENNRAIRLASGHCEENRGWASRSLRQFLTRNSVQSHRSANWGITARSDVQSSASNLSQSHLSANWGWVARSDIQSFA